jgi:hypothetical protein
MPSSPRREQTKAVVEMLRDLPGRERLELSRREFDRQRNSVQMMADLGYRRAVLRGQRKRRLHGTRSVHKQPHRVEIGQHRERWQSLGVGSGQRGNLPGGFALNIEGFSAGCQNPQGGAELEHRLRQAGRGIQQVLAVIQH